MALETPPLYMQQFALFFRFFDSWYIIKYLLTSNIDIKTSTVEDPQNILLPRGLNL